MYFVKYGKQYLHDPRIDDCTLLDLSLNSEENSCGFCDFTIYPNHPMYDNLTERDADNPIQVYDDNILLFVGFIYELGTEFYLDGHVKCKGELDYLSETIIRPYATYQRGYGEKAPDNLSDYFNWIIEQHNRQVNDNKKFKIGINQAGKFEIKDGFYIENNKYPKTIDEISSIFIGDSGIGGYLSVRYSNGIRYLDYVYDWENTNVQLLDFGVNLTNYTQTDDSESISTFIVPIGATVSSTDYPYNDGYFKTSDTTVNNLKEYYTKTYKYKACESLEYFAYGLTYYEYKGTDTYTATTDATPVTGKTYYLYVCTGRSKCNDLASFESGVTYYEYNENNDESNLPITLDGLTISAYRDGDYVKLDDMIYSKSAVSKYGWIGHTISSSEIKIKEELIQDAISALDLLISPKRTIEIKAVDMHLVNPDLMPIRIGEYVRVRSVPHKLDSYFICRGIDLDLNNPENSLYTLGTTFDTLTGEQNKRINELNSEVNKQKEIADRLSSSEKETASLAESIDSKFNNLKVGGTNLLLGTKNFDSGVWHNLQYWTPVEPAVYGYQDYVRTESNNGIYQKVQVLSGYLYTFSFFAKKATDSTASLVVKTKKPDIYVSDIEGILVSVFSEHFAEDLYSEEELISSPEYAVIGDITDTYVRYHATFRAIKSGYVYPRVENEIDSQIHVYRFKFEMGGIPTDWSPAPEDLSSVMASQDDAICALYEMIIGG